MIKNLILRGVSSYSPEQNSQIGPLTKVNMFYGHNGTGKTTIGNYLQDPSDLLYHQCKTQPVSAEREVMVYNHTFMETNFHASSQPGIFTLNEGNIEAEKKLLAAEEALKKLLVEHQAEVAAGNGFGESQKSNKADLLDQLWALKRPFDSGPLRYCFASLNTKDRLGEKLRTLSLVSSPDDFSALAAEAEQLQSASDAELPGIPIIRFAEADVEASSLLSEAIAGSGDSYLSALITDLGNSDWVKRGLQYPQREECPFCQQTLPSGFYEEIQKVFDKTYEQRITQLKALKTRYEGGVTRLRTQFKRPEYDASEYQLLITKLDALLSQNAQKLDAKVASPSMVVALEPTGLIIDDLTDLIAEGQRKIDAFNLKVKDKKNHLEKIKTRFWICFRSSCDGAIASAKKVHEELGVKKEAKRKLADEIRLKSQAHQDVIAESKAKITNIDQSVGSINASLTALGLNGFVVVKEDAELPRYRLQRPDQQAGVFKTLSEGEKTLISFLYFLEVCNGELDEKSGKLKSERIIVIDDPISSLSHNYIYDIATMIHRRVLSPKERFKQVFILTHNLFFFHEMLKHLRKSDEYSLFRITKAAHSMITPMKASDVQNDYQSFWQAIKDAQAGRTSPSVIPNMMRNILEYYFTFVHRQDELQAALMALSDEDAEFKALYRYVNRESHSDAVNLTDFGEIVPSHYVDRFREVFVRTGFEEHYEKMMGEHA
ncbi:AAA family ATPase [Pseudomonas fluorescens]|uniref:AAA family ATPase n=1 Tax=Pseudomonas fluorescens TaxID=294 RepID=UPI00177FEEA6|nr:AAA family ATPase [Pseudomonas fluorescens]MBD8175179.1 AAA family ATPase [Pseudomonas fluorescens]MBD8743635.1 AAA family ATPase [Pseudomonas fluorescens]MBD8753471.1 AAA family ATPase [Pseudomonas fluorescens]MBD8759565.1 AAA family ATPase [Pseudomonas fluorescens]